MEASHQHWSPDCPTAERGMMGGKKGTQAAQTRVSINLQPPLRVQQLKQSLRLKDRALQPLQALSLHPRLTNPRLHGTLPLSVKTDGCQQTLQLAQEIYYNARTEPFSDRMFQVEQVLDFKCRKKKV